MCSSSSEKLVAVGGSVQCSTTAERSAVRCVESLYEREKEAVRSTVFEARPFGSGTLEGLRDRGRRQGCRGWAGLTGLIMGPCPPDRELAVEMMRVQRRTESAGSRNACVVCEV